MGTTIIMMAAFFGIRAVYTVPISWLTFAIVCVIAGVVGCIINFLVYLDVKERKILVNKILAKVKR